MKEKLKQRKGGHEQMLRQTTAVFVAFAAFITSQVVLLAVALGRLALAGATIALLIETVCFSILIWIVLDGRFVDSRLAMGIAYQ